jgi:hypothetical protein
MRIRILPPSLALCTLMLGCKHETKIHELKDVFETFGRHKPTASFPFFALGDEAKRNIEKYRLEIFIKAQADIDLIYSDQQPIFCNQEVVVIDGGTTIFKGRYYNITKHSQLNQMNGLPCILHGITIHFNGGRIGSPELKEISQTWVEFLP